MHASRFFLSVIVVATATSLLACSPSPLPGGDGSASSSAASSVSSDISVILPQPGALAASPLSVVGEARGTWFFEGSFPVRLLDGAGNQIAASPVTASGNWMTTDFVPFSVLLPFVVPPTLTGTLILEKDNPSGLPENAASISIPIRFRP